jgi:hypothetical protein
MSTPCRLQAFEKWSVHHHLYGLQCLSQTLSVETKAFDCCGAEGLTLNELGDGSQGLAVSYCGLIARIHLIQKLSSVLSSDLSKGASQHFSKAIGLQSKQRDQEGMRVQEILLTTEKWRRLMKKPIEESSKGRLIADSQLLETGTSDLWPTLFSFAWHDGYIPIVVRQKSNVLDINEWTRIIQKNPHKKIFFVAMGVGALFDPIKLEMFSELVEYSWRVSRPLWIVTESSEESNVAKSNRFSDAVGQRVKKFRNSRIESYLSPELLLKLQDICELPQSTNNI